MRVKVNALYKYNPNGWDRFRPCTGNTLSTGDIVRVINLPMAPKCNTMGQCYVANPFTGQFICMCSTGSLEHLSASERDRINRIARKQNTKTAIVPTVLEQKLFGTPITYKR